MRPIVTLGSGGRGAGDLCGLSLAVRQELATRRAACLGRVPAFRPVPWP